jgi:hypothetical protein
MIVLLVLTAVCGWTGLWVVILLDKIASQLKRIADSRDDEQEGGPE